MRSLLIKMETFRINVNNHSIKLNYKMLLGDYDI